MTEEPDEGVGDAPKVKRRKRAQKKQEELDKIALQALLKMYEFRAFVWHLLASCGVYHDFYISDPDIGKKIGRRSVGLELLDLVLTADPNIYTQMRNEAVSRDTGIVKAGEGD